MPDGLLRCQPTQNRGLLSVLGVRNCVAMLPTMEAITTVWARKARSSAGRGGAFTFMSRAIEQGCHSTPAALGR